MCLSCIDINISYNYAFGVALLIGERFFKRALPLHYWQTEALVPAGRQGPVEVERRVAEDTPLEGWLEVYVDLREKQTGIAVVSRTAISCITDYHKVEERRVVVG